MTATEHHANLSSHPSSADVIVVGAGFAGLVAACEAVEAGRSVLILDQKGPNNLGGQAWWSFGGLFLVDSPEQRRFGVKDSLELAKQDWGLTAGFDRPEDYWPRLWAEKYVEWAAGEKRAWLRDRGVSLFPVVGWAERGEIGGIGNSVPRFHITWGTGPGLLKPFIERVLRAASTGQVRFGWRHRLQNIDYDDATSAVTGVSGDILAPDSAERGEASSREVVGSFSLSAPRVVIATCGIGGNPDKVRAAWPERLGSAPEHFLTGVPACVGGSGIEAVENAGGRVIGCGITPKASKTGIRSGRSTASAFCPAPAPCGLMLRATACRTGSGPVSTPSERSPA